LTWQAEANRAAEIKVWRINEARLRPGMLLGGEELAQTILLADGARLDSKGRRRKRKTRLCEWLTRTVIGRHQKKRR
jgi:hypothetical protein